MTCPRCHTHDTQLDTELHTLGSCVSRVYVCGDCGVTFATREAVTAVDDDSDTRGNA